MWTTTVGLCVRECPGSDFSAWYMTYALMCVLMAGPQLMLVRLLLDAIKYQFECEDEAEEERIHKIDNDDLNEDDMVDDEYDPFEEKYPERIRELGSGPARILTPIEIREDLYSYIFALSFHPEYVYACEKENDEKDEIMGKLRAQAKRKAFK